MCDREGGGKCGPVNVKHRPSSCPVPAQCGQEPQEQLSVRMGPRNEEMLLARIKFGSIGGHADLFLSVCMTSNAQKRCLARPIASAAAEVSGPRSGVNRPSDDELTFGK